MAVDPVGMAVIVLVETDRWSLCFLEAPCAVHKIPTGDVYYYSVVWTSIDCCSLDVVREPVASHNCLLSDAQPPQSSLQSPATV